MKIQELIDPLKDAVYGAGEPTGEAHGRMKAAMQAAGILRSATVLPPTKEPSKEELIEIQAAVKAAGLIPRAPPSATCWRTAVAFLGAARHRPAL